MLFKTMVTIIKTFILGRVHLMLMGNFANVI